MNKHLAFLLSAIICTTASKITAQKLQAYYVIGEVSYIKNGISHPLVMKSEITPNTIINIPYGGKVEFIDISNSKRITIAKPGKGSVTALSHANGNSISDVTSRYLAYIEKQMSNKGLVSQKRYTDFATVTRTIEIYTQKDTKTKSFTDKFNDFKARSRSEFEAFRQKNNKTYASFLRKAWETIHPNDPIPYPNKKEVPPIIYDDTLGIKDIRITKPVVKVVKKIVKFKKEEIEVLRDKRQPQPATPPSRSTLPAKEYNDIPIQRVEIPEQIRKYSTMPVDFFGQELEVHIDESKRLNIGEITPDNIADIYENQLSTKYYDNLLVDCLKLRKNLKLCDWAYLLLIKKISDQLCLEGTNEAALLAGYLYCQSGYKMRYACDQKNHLYLMVASKHTIYDTSCYPMEDEFYYPIVDVNEPISFCKASFPQEKCLSLYIPYAQEFTGQQGEIREIASKRFPDFKITVSVNKSLIDFYNTYPMSYIAPDQSKRWALYAETPMNEKVKKQIYPIMHQKLDSLTEYEKVAHIYDLIDQGIPYGFDSVIWGYDRVFFAEETLNYPLCDCEDRAILFTRLVRDLVGLQCALVYYPGHLAAAVKFNVPTGGSHYSCEGIDYTLCDPTYIGARIGEEMPAYKDKNVATLIPLQVK